MQLHASGAHAVPPATDVSYVNGWEEIDPLSRVEMKKMCWQKDDSIVSAPLGMLRGFCHAQHLRNTHATRVLRDHATLYFTVLCARGM